MKDKTIFYIMMVFLIFFVVGFFLLVHENSIQREKIESALDLSRYYENKYKDLEVNIENQTCIPTECDCADWGCLAMCWDCSQNTGDKKQ